MALLAFSFIGAVLLAALTWLVIGSRFPLKAAAAEKLPVANNIFIYAAMALIPMYLLVFTFFKF